ncbi:MAG: response regulator [Bacteroidales bacterium]|nr:response regulator [Bacteroidales bacterium]
MKSVAVFDLISFLVTLSGMIVLLWIRKKRINRDIKLLIIGLLFLIILYDFSLFVEWSGITDELDPYEDLIGAMIPMMWAFLFYAFIQKIGNIDLLESENRLDMALKGTRAGLWDWNIQSGHVIYNERWAEIIGYKLKEIGPLNKETWTNHVHPDDLKKSDELLEKHFDGQTPFYECEIRMQHKNGEWIWVMDRGMVIERDNEGKPVRMTGTYIDITKQKSTEKKLNEQIEKNQAINKKYFDQNKELMASIEHIKSINQELITAKERAEESDRLKSAFLANMSHEIRTPMNGILGFASLLNSRKLDESKKQKYIALIRESGIRMLNIINDLIDISKIEAGQIEVQFARVNIKEILDEMYLFFKPEAEKRGLVFSYSSTLTDEDNMMITDITKLKQILSNLINNALKYTDKGKIDFGCSRAGNSVEFFVRDTGVGIPGDLREKVFERFRQVDLNVHRAKEGTGLGLTISKAYLEKMGGNIWMQSKPGEGSVFYFSIPYGNTLNDTQHKDSVSEDIIRYRQKATVLVAEDDEIGFIYLKELLSFYDISVLRANNGKEAVEMCKNNDEIQLVFMDIKMPEMDGLEAIQHIKQVRKSLPVIVQSAYAMNEDKERARKAGCEDYLTKPIKQNELNSVIKKYFDDIDN